MKCIIATTLMAALILGACSSGEGESSAPSEDSESSAGSELSANSQEALDEIAAQSEGLPYSQEFEAAAAACVEDSFPESAGQEFLDEMEEWGKCNSSEYCDRIIDDLIEAGEVETWDQCYDEALDRFFSELPWFQLSPLQQEFVDALISPIEDDPMAEPMAVAAVECLVNESADWIPESGDELEVWWQCLFGGFCDLVGDEIIAVDETDEIETWDDCYSLLYDTYRSGL